LRNHLDADADSTQQREDVAGETSPGGRSFADDARSPPSRV
jgi:hypothetical protein